MFEECLPRVYRIPVPLPNNPLRELNSYLLLGGDRDLLVDTGFRQPECRAALFAALKELGARPGRTDVLLTHLHSDHSGLAPEVTEAGGHIYVSTIDRAQLEGYNDGTRESWRAMDRVFSAEGFPPELMAQNSTNPARALAPAAAHNYVSLSDGQVLTVGEYRLRCLLTPGHTPGQMCFWLEEQKAMLLGDHVLFDITPNITSWPGVDDSLGDYLDSLKAVRGYDVVLPLPGHRGRGDFKGRIDELIEHHGHRLEEAFAAVRDHPGLGAYRLAGFMTWKIRASTWDDFPLAQKWFAVGECISHLDHLRAQGRIRRETDARGSHLYYAL